MSDPSAPPHSSNAYYLSDERFAQVRDLLAAYAGIYLDRTGQRGLATALRERTRATDQPLESYLNYIVQPRGRGELHELAELLLNHETIFFRNQAHMSSLSDVVLPYLHRTKPANEPLRIWSAGCSTGEEPYSLAMLAAEHVGLPLSRPVQIYGTDLSAAALHKARQARYRGRTLTNVSADMRRRYFSWHDDVWHLREPIRQMVTFEQRNLLEPFPAWVSGLDIIFCQNVTIYFELATFRQLAERFYRALPTGGMLFLGFSETLWNVFDGFQLHELGGAFVYVKGKLPLLSQRTASGRLLDPDASPAPPVPASLATRPLRPRIPAESAPVPRPSTGELRRAARPPRPASPAPLSDGAALVQQGREWLEAGELERVLELHRHVATSGKDAPQLLALIARAHANRGAVEMAIAEARRALELDNMVTDAYHLLGMLCQQQNEPQESIHYLERARYLEPNAPLISFHLAEAYRVTRRSEQALREYRATLRKLAAFAPDAVLDGVAVGWLRASCERHIQQLNRQP